MQILSDAAQRQIKERLAELAGDVKITLFTQPESPIIIPGRDCATCQETGQILREVADLSEKLTLEVHDFYNEMELARDRGIDRIPAFTLEGAARGSVRYFGVPAGHEFPAFIDDVIDVSRGSTSLSDESRVSLGRLTRDVHIQVFITPT